MALPLLLIVLAGVAWMRIRQGFLTPESALAALRFLLRFTVLPMFIFGLLWRLSAKSTGPQAMRPDGSAAASVSAKGEE